MSGWTRTMTVLIAWALGGLLVLLANACATHQPRQRAHPQLEPYRLTEQDDRFLEDLSHRSFQFFWEQADPATGIVRDRARTDGSPSEAARDIGSIASVGFGLSSLCIAAERGWLPRASGVDRARTTLQVFAR